MSTLPPPWDPSDDADEQYRRASERDPSRPGEDTRRAVLAHATRLAAQRARGGALRRALSLAASVLRSRQAIIGTAAAAALAGVVIAPQFLAPPAQRASEIAPAAAPAPAAPAPSAPVASGPSATASSVAPAPAPPIATSVAPAAARAPQVRAGRESAPLASLQRARVPSNASYAAAASPAASASDATVQRAPPARADELRHAAEAGDVAAIARQLASGGDIDARDTQGRTALMLATLNGRTDIVRMLLVRGADPNAADASGTTPLQAALAGNEREISSLLQRYGAR